MSQDNLAIENCVSRPGKKQKYNVKHVDLVLETKHNFRPKQESRSSSSYQDLDTRPQKLPESRSLKPPNVQRDPSSPEDLYQQLTDKNRAIEVLKRRLTNQQIQLGYYLHKNLATEAVLEFSNKCIPHLAEDSTQLSLAMYKFIRDTGGKTRLVQLREKLTEYNNRVHKVLLRQEQLIRQGFGFDETDNLKQIEESTAIVQDKEQSKKYYQTAKLELCSQLLGITLQVRKELEQFRACAENIVRLEEERNALVDRVFSLPPEQRYGNLRVSVVENSETIAASSPSTTSVSTNTTVDADEKHKGNFKSLGGALQDMESEAIQLLLLSEKQKNEFVIALEEARVENQQLRERLRDLEEAASDERVISLQEKCNNIEAEVDFMKKSLEKEQDEKEKLINKMASELEERDVRENNMKLEVKKLSASFDAIRHEKMALLKQLDATNAKFCHTHKNTSTDDMKTAISEAVSQQNVEDLTDLVVMQEEQIKDLLSIMSGLNSNVQETSSFVSVEEMKSSMPDDSLAGDTNAEYILEADRPDTRAAKISDHNFEEVIKTPELDAADVDIEIEEPVQDKVQSAENRDDYQIYYDSSSEFTTNHDFSDDGRTEQKDAVTCETKESTPKKSVSIASDKKTRIGRTTRSVTRRAHFNKKVKHIPDRDIHFHHGVATTSLRVQAFDKDGKSESMHAVLECSSPVDGLLEMNNASKLHLRLQCTSPQRGEYLESRGSRRTDQSREESVPYSEKHISGDHTRSDNHPQMSQEAKIYLAEQLNKIKSQLETSSSLDVRQEIVQNLNEIYCQLFEDEVMTQSSQS